jgi:hypothetical protein
MFKLAAFISLVGISCASSKASQETQVYAYSRSTLPGRQEGIRPLPGLPAEIINYFIYVEQVDVGMSVKTVWISGIPYRATLQRATLPVTFESGGIGTNNHIDTVFHSGSKPVFRIIPGEQIADRSHGRKRNLVNENAVLVEIESGERHLLGISRDFKKLNPIVFQ